MTEEERAELWRQQRDARKRLGEALEKDLYGPADHEYLAGIRDRTTHTRPEPEHKGVIANL